MVEYYRHGIWDHIDENKTGKLDELTLTTNVDYPEIAELRRKRLK